MAFNYWKRKTELQCVGGCQEAIVRMETVRKRNKKVSIKNCIILRDYEWIVDVVDHSWVEARTKQFWRVRGTRGDSQDSRIHTEKQHQKFELITNKVSSRFDCSIRQTFD